MYIQIKSFQVISDAGSLPTLSIYSIYLNKDI